MPMRSAPILFLLFVLPFCATAQQLLHPLNDSYDADIQQAVYSSTHRYHSSVKPWIASELRLVAHTDSISKASQINNPFSKKWQQTGFDMLFNSDFIHLRGKDYYIAVNPLLQFEAGTDRRSGNTTWINTRGIEVKGDLGERFSFYSSFRENQAVYPAYIDGFVRKNRVVPGQGMYKGFGSNGFDYAFSTAYLSVKAAKWFNVQFGHGRNFLGDGYRSLLLSDNAFPNAYLKLTGEVWHLKYVALYSQLIDIRAKLSENLGYERKYTTIHYLSWAATPRLNISFFDAIVWQATDSSGHRGFDLQYLNPIIFLRPVEFSIGSPDNALMGLNISYIVGKHSVFYGQLALDEFKISEIRAGNGWWANKQAFQLGLKAHNAFGVKNLFLQTEYNWVRPYMYTHFSVKQNYGHYNQPLAHPWGANFRESVSRLRYHYKRWYLHNELIYGLYGEDYDGLNYGRNIYLDYNTRVSEYGNKVGQGLKTTLLFNDLTLSWLINPVYKLNVYAGLGIRQLRSDQQTDNDVILRFGLRTSLENFYMDF